MPPIILPLALFAFADVCVTVAFSVSVTTVTFRGTAFVVSAFKVGSAFSAVFIDVDDDAINDAVVVVAMVGDAVVPGSVAAAVVRDVGSVEGVPAL